METLAGRVEQWQGRERQKLDHELAHKLVSISGKVKEGTRLKTAQLLKHPDILRIEEKKKKVESLKDDLTETLIKNNTRKKLTEMWVQKAPKEDVAGFYKPQDKSVSVTNEFIDNIEQSDLSLEEKKQSIEHVAIHEDGHARIASEEGDPLPVEQYAAYHDFEEAIVEEYALRLSNKPRSQGAYKEQRSLYISALQSLGILEQTLHAISRGDLPAVRESFTQTHAYITNTADSQTQALAA